jgi:hypothetical protein
MITYLLGVVNPILLTILVPLSVYAEAVEKSTEVPWVGAVVLFVFMAICAGFVVHSTLTAPKLKSAEWWE